MSYLRCLASRPVIHEFTYFFNIRLEKKNIKCDFQAALAYRQFQLNNRSYIHYFFASHLKNYKSVLAKPTYSKCQVRKRGSSNSEHPQTDFGGLDLLANSPVPSTSIDACLWDGFHLNNGVKITNGDGVILVTGEAFRWQPWVARQDCKPKLLNDKGQWEVEDDAWGIFTVIWPKPDLLILGLGREMRQLSPKTTAKIHSLGLRLDIQDTKNAAAQFNLLATERGLGNVAAALIPIGWNEQVDLKYNKSNSI